MPWNSSDSLAIIGPDQSEVKTGIKRKVVIRRTGCISNVSKRKSRKRDEHQSGDDSSKCERIASKIELQNERVQENYGGEQKDKTSKMDDSTNETALVIRNIFENSHSQTGH